MVVIRKQRPKNSMFFWGGDGSANSQINRRTPPISGSIAFTNAIANAQHPIPFSWRCLRITFNSVINSKAADNTLESVLDDGVSIPNTLLTIPFGSVAKFDSGPINELVLAGSECCFQCDTTLQVSGGITGSVVMTGERT